MSIVIPAELVQKNDRAQIKKQKPTCIWLTGLSGAGKSTIATELESQLARRGLHTYLLDGDKLRSGLNCDLGFTDADRNENVRRAAHVAHLMVDAGLIVIVSFISPFMRQRALARALFEPDEFVEVYIDCPLAECERRDVKGLYRKARAGHLPQFTGIDSPYEPPLDPEVHVHSDLGTPEDAAQYIQEHLRRSGRL